MKRLIGGMALTAIGAGAAVAGGVERSSQSTAILFEDGTYAELSYGYVEPSVSGVQGFTVFGPLLEGNTTGDVAPGYSVPSFGFKTELADKLHAALIIDQPIGAHVDYADPGYLYGFLGGSQAELKSYGVTALLRYELPRNVSVFGGVRMQETSGTVGLFTGYELETSKEQDWGYVVGAAWEMPEIAMRIALTYNSAINHAFSADESTSATPTSFSTEIPQSLNLEFQTGIAADTLLFGSIRWVDWTEFDVTPPGYLDSVGAPLVSYDDDTITYNLGVGRRFNDKWSGAVTLGYEQSQGGFASNLGPTDGFFSVGLGGTYTMDKIELSGGVRYFLIGDAKTEAPAVTGQPPGTTMGDFTDNSGVAVGCKIAYTF